MDEAIAHRIENIDRENRIKRIISHNDEYRDIVYKFKREVSETNKQVMNTLLKIIKAKDEEIYNHCRNVSRY